MDGLTTEGVRRFLTTVGINPASLLELHIQPGSAVLTAARPGGARRLPMPRLLAARHNPETALGRLLAAAGAHPDDRLAELLITPALVTITTADPGGRLRTECAVIGLAASDQPGTRRAAKMYATPPQ